MQKINYVKKEKGTLHHIISECFFKFIVVVNNFYWFSFMAPFLMNISSFCFSFITVSQTCNKDHDCGHLRTPSCCARSTLGDFRICKPLGEEGSTCNVFSQKHLWEGERDGFYCPCDTGLSCQGRRRGMCLI